MTYSDIYTKFLIEYDKQNITSSYPSLTVYEIATLLDKAYLALIAQKLTGNNPRRAPFEIDIKAIEDLRPLLSQTRIQPDSNYHGGFADNINAFKMPDKDTYLYFVSATINANVNINNVTRFYEDPVVLVPHNVFEKFKASSFNMPWIKTPTGCLENDYLLVATDPFSYVDEDDINVGVQYQNNITLTYIRKPQPFILDDDKDAFHGHIVDGETVQYEFELNDSMAEELINLAIVMALETVESPRIQMKENTRALES